MDRYGLALDDFEEIRQGLYLKRELTAETESGAKPVLVYIESGRVERNEAAESRKKADGRSPFEVFVEACYQVASRAPFFFVCLFIVVAWFVSVPWWVDLKAWQVAIHTVASVMTLLLLALPPEVFEAIVPWLILFTCLLVGVSPALNRRLRERRSRAGSHASRRCASGLTALVRR